MNLFYMLRRMIYMVYDSYEFGKYIMELRRKDNLSMNVICEGICDVSVMSRIESGEREVSKLVQDRILGRLGVAPENFENMIFSDEYERWKVRQKIISLIQHEKINEADELLEHMFVENRLIERKKSVEDLDAILEMQFYLAMKAQIKRYNNADDKELRKLYADAVNQTVAKFDMDKSLKDFFDNKKFSIEEINLLIEYGRYISVTRGVRLLKCIITYLDKNRFTDLAKSKVYPKAVYYLYLAEKKMGMDKEREINLLIGLSTDAIECLRTASRTFYLYELLEMKLELISGKMNVNAGLSVHSIGDVSVDDKYMNDFGNTDEFSLEAQYIWCRNMLLAMNEIYTRCGIRKDTFEYGYIYVDGEVYCIEDVIRIRRNMLNISMRKLSSGVCSERTISRIEKKSVKPQCAIVHKLFSKLGLSCEFSRTELVSSNVEVQEKLVKLKNYINSREHYKANEILTELSKAVSMDIPQNKQVLTRIRACSDRTQGKLSELEYIKQIKAALECTLPYNVAISNSEKYLTDEEMSCMCNILVSKKMDVPEVRQCFDALLRINNSREPYINSYLSMYEFTMHIIASRMGDCGRYDESDSMEEVILENTLINRRVTVAAIVLYGMLWNDLQRNNKKIAASDDAAISSELKLCVIISNFTKNVLRYKFFCKRLRTDD